MRFGGGHVGPDDDFVDVWDIYAGVLHARGLEMLSWHLALSKDHFDISYVWFGGGHVGPDESFGDVWDTPASVVHDRGLEISFWHLALHKDHFDISYVRFGGGHVGPDEGFGDVQVIHAGVVHGGGLEVSSWHLTLYMDPFDTYGYVRVWTFVNLTMGIFISLDPRKRRIVDIGWLSFWHYIHESSFSWI